MRIHKEDRSTTERKKISSRWIECSRRIRRGGWKGIVQKRSGGVRPRRAVVGCAGHSVCRARASRRRLQAWKIDERLTVIRRRAVELQIVFALEHVIKDADAAADADLTSTSRTPGKSEAGAKVVLVWEVGSPRRSRISGKN